MENKLKINPVFVIQLLILAVALVVLWFAWRCGCRKCCGSGSAGYWFSNGSGFYEIYVNNDGKTVSTNGAPVGYPVVYIPLPFFPLPIPVGVIPTLVTSSGCPCDILENLTINGQTMRVDFWIQTIEWEMSVHYQCQYNSTNCEYISKLKEYGGVVYDWSNSNTTCLGDYYSPYVCFGGKDLKGVCAKEIVLAYFYEKQKYGSIYQRENCGSVRSVPISFDPIPVQNNSDLPLVPNIDGGGLYGGGGGGLIYYDPRYLPGNLG